uniref:Retrotransposon protein, putative, Ty1-copia subclass n=1 Tax=Oryza sativa subsp. japonica TaxID=39947 RepID=Q2RBK4_ORYSJ|nr:retrotransposon protein, putative, Ty1-copia subclass [Oryza sativa Japonica Group]
MSGVAAAATGGGGAPPPTGAGAPPPTGAGSGAGAPGGGAVNDYNNGGNSASPSSGGPFSGYNLLLLLLLLALFLFPLLALYCVRYVLVPVLHDASSMLSRYWYVPVSDIHDAHSMLLVMLRSPYTAYAMIIVSISWIKICRIMTIFPTKRTLFPPLKSSLERMNEWYMGSIIDLKLAAYYRYAGPAIQLLGFT